MHLFLEQLQMSMSLDSNQSIYHLRLLGLVLKSLHHVKKKWFPDFQDIFCSTKEIGSACFIDQADTQEK